MPSRRLIILGSTGSIGVNALNVVEHLRSRGLFEFEVVGIAAGANAQLLGQQAQRFNVKHVAIADGGRSLSLGKDVHVYSGPDAALELINAAAKSGDIVLGAMVGSAGVPAILAAIERGCDIALANKETLVAAGALVIPKIRERGVHLLPVDSEHSAIFQCLQESSKRQNVQTSKLDCDDSTIRRSDVCRVVLTASGGPFRTWTKQRVDNATVEEALNHPTWNMGPKVTIDSASLMNKALEIIEAHWLFDLRSDQIEVIIHPQSLIHSFVEFVDGSILAQLGPPDMKTPIQYALTWPQRIDGCSKKMDWSSLRKMDFEAVDPEKFAAPRLAYEVIEAGGTAGAIFNAANEAAVHAFLNRAINFGNIAGVVEQTLNAIESVPVRTLDDVFHADQAARRFVRETIARTPVTQVEPTVAAPGPALRSGPA